MTPIPEYYLRSAVPVGGGERVTGYLREIPHDGNPEIKTSIIEWYVVDDTGKIHHRFCEADPATVEPVRVRPIQRSLLGSKIPYFTCPNCDDQVDELMPDYFCGSCGMALDWSDAP